MLVIAMASGIILYLVYSNIPAFRPADRYVSGAISVIQPLLIFMMLFLTFCRISPHDLKPRRWHLRLLIFQGGIFTAMALCLTLIPDSGGRILAESAMLCIICPTATAAAVVTGKLNGDISGVTTYTILANIMTGILVPLLVPIVHPVEGMTFFTASGMIMVKVFPMLICPCLAAWMVRYLLPGLHRRLLRSGDLAFYTWGIALCLAIAVTTRSLAHSTVPVYYQAGIAAVSLICCVLQFWAGRKIGKRFGAGITAGQALGQKNTVFAIWMGFTFMTPVTSVAGGFYSLWHNAYNSWQLYRKGKNGQ